MANLLFDYFVCVSSNEGVQAAVRSSPQYLRSVRLEPTSAGVPIVLGTSTWVGRMFVLFVSMLLRFAGGFRCKTLKC